MEMAWIGALRCEASSAVFEKKWQENQRKKGGPGIKKGRLLESLYFLYFFLVFFWGEASSAVFENMGFPAVELMLDPESGRIWHGPSIFSIFLPFSDLGGQK